LLDATGGLIDGSGNPADFVLRRFEDSSLKIAFSNPPGHIDDAIEATSAPLRRGGGHDKREKKGYSGSQFQPLANLCRNCFYIGERIGQADSAAEDGHGHIEKRDAESGAAALVAADPAVQGGSEFWARCMVFHAGGSRLGIGQHVAGGIDDRDAGAGGLAFLGSDISERMAAVGFDAMSQKLGFLDKIALDFIA